MTGNRGVILLSVVIILLTMALIGASLAALFSLVNTTAQRIANETKALFLAEAGIAQVIYILHNQTGPEGLDKIIGPFSLGEGTFVAKIDFIHSLITSTGEVGGVKKTLQLQYKGL